MPDLKEKTPLSVRIQKKTKNFYIHLISDPAFRLGSILVLMIFFSMVAILVIEKDKNDNLQNLFDSFWYTIVTITTVGYGDISPATYLGRIIGLFTMAFGVIVFGSVTGKIASFLVDQQLRRGRGLLKLKNLSNHFIICGWKNDYEQIIDGVLEANPGLERSELVLINNCSTEYMETFLSNPKYKPLNYIYGDFIEESVLLRANIKTASKVMILADNAQSYSAMEIDARTVLAVLTIENLNRNIYTAAELIDEKFEKHLSFAHCDEIILSKEYERNLLVNASAGTGVSHVVRDLLTYEDEVGLVIIDIPGKYINDTFHNLFEYFYNEKKAILVGILENTGNFYARKKEALGEAQKSPDIAKIVDNLKKVKDLKANNSVLAPDRDYVIKKHSKAIVVGEYSR
ncbi:MAG: ion channel [Spirochaetes bacterium]|nr:ion channel [Spirochaetota bacterium]